MEVMVWVVLGWAFEGRVEVVGWERAERWEDIFVVVGLGVEVEVMR